MVVMGASSAIGTLIGGRDLGKRALLGSRYFVEATRPTPRLRQIAYTNPHPNYMVPARPYGHPSSTHPSTHRTLRPIMNAPPQVSTPESIVPLHPHPYAPQQGAVGPYVGHDMQYVALPPGPPPALPDIGHQYAPALAPTHDFRNYQTYPGDYYHGTTMQAIMN